MVGVFSFSDVGGHRINEDAFAVHRHPDDADCWLCFLADGAGGCGGGERAAQLACRCAAPAALSEPPERLTAPSSWVRILGSADAAVCSDPWAGFTTLIGFCIRRGHLVGASCGDSSVLLRTAEARPREVTAGQPDNQFVGSGRPGSLPSALP